MTKRKVKPKVTTAEYEEALHGLQEIIYWMSGSADFSPGGQAYKGWISVRRKMQSIVRRVRVVPT